MAGLELSLPGGREMRVNSTVPSGHRFATRTIPAGEYVLQYGQPIGTSLGIECGDAIICENLSNDVPVIRDLRAGQHTAAPDYLPERERATFMGFRRQDGRVGRGNFVLIVPTSMCASHEAQQISIIAEYTWYNQIGRAHV